MAALRAGAAWSALAVAALGADGTRAAGGADEPAGPGWERVADLDGVRRLFASPVDAAVVFAAREADDGPALLVSRDRGRSFAACGTADDLPGPVTALLIDPLRPQRLYAGTAAHGVLTSDDGGAHWRPGGAGLAHPRIHALVFAPEDPTDATIYASHSLDQPGLSVSRDAGRSWSAFADGFGVGDLAVLDEALFCAASSAAQGTGFFRHDATKGWFCVLSEAPRAVMASPVEAGRLYFASLDRGLRRSDSAGISSAPAGPQEVDVEALAADVDEAGHETVFAIAPQSTGVISSQDGFVTWRAWTKGLSPTEWAAEGASLAVASDGATLYAEVNGAVYRLERIGVAERVPVSVVPAIVAEGAGPVVVEAIAPAAAQPTVDFGALGGPADAAMRPVGAVDGAGLQRWRARLETVAVSPKQKRRSASAPARAIGVRVTTPDGKTRGGRAIVRVLPEARDEILWDATRLGETRAHGAWVAKAEAIPSGEACLHLRIDGEGGLKLPLHGPDGNAMPVHDHALIALDLRSDQSGPLALRLTGHDNGQGSGTQNSQPSRTIDLGAATAALDGQVRTVVVPVGELLQDSTCSPSLIDLTLESAAGMTPRLVDLLPVRLLAQPGPRLLDAAVVPVDATTAAVVVVARGLNSPPSRASARIRAEPRALALVEAPPSAEPAGWEGRLAARSLREGTFTGTVPLADLAPGAHACEIDVEDEHGLTRATAIVLVPSALATIPAVDSTAEGEASLAEPALKDALASASPVSVSGASGSAPLTARLAWSPKSLAIAVEVMDPGAVTASSPTPGKTPQGPRAELEIGQAVDGKPAHRVVIAWAGAAPGAWCDGKPVPCVGARCEGGYRALAAAPIALRPTGRPGPGEAGRLVLLQAMLAGSDGRVLLWSREAGCGAAAVRDADRVGGR
jgi:hypothetical protein